MNRYIIATLVLLLACGMGVAGYLYLRSKPCSSLSPIEVTVFVHGTVGTEFNMFSPLHCLSDTASETTLSTRLSRKFRSHPYLQHDQLISQEGMIEIPYDRIQRYRNEKTQDIDTRNAWYHILATYDDIAHRVGVASGKQHYVLFGWTGLLSNRARKRAGYDLYQQLRSLRRRIRNAYGCEPRMRVVTHSHGGNVALWAAQAAAEDEAAMQIDMLFMMATPIQPETIEFIRLPFYKTIISSYSRGDSIQGSDFLSTSHHQSYQRMADLGDLNAAVRESGGVRADMQYVINLQHHVVTHANMWLMGKSNPILTCMQPLPLVAVVPAFFACVDEHTSYTQYQAHLYNSPGHCVSQLVGVDGVLRSLVYRSPNLYSLIERGQTRTNRIWDPVDTSRHLVFNYKNFSAMRHAFGL